MTDQEKPTLVGSGGIVIDAATILKRIEELQQQAEEESHGN